MTGELVQHQQFDLVDPSAIAAAEAVKARIQAAYVMAARKPRNEAQARDRILEACRRPEFAARVEYAKPIYGGKDDDKNTKRDDKGKKYLRGPSIRFAELSLREWGNIMSDIQVLYEDDSVRRVRVNILDLETNTQFSKDIQVRKTVERKSKKGREDDVLSERKNAYGETVYILRATDEEMYTKESAWISKVLRNEGLRLIPSDITDEALATARDTLAKQDSEDPKAATKKVMDAMSSIGVKPKELQKFFGGQSIETLSPAQLKELRGIYAAIRDGDASWSDYVNKAAEDAEAKEKTANLTDAIKGKKSDPEKPPAPQAHETTDDPLPNPCPNQWDPPKPENCGECGMFDGCKDPRKEA